MLHFNCTHVTFSVFSWFHFQDWASNLLWLEIFHWDRRTNQKIHDKLQPQSNIMWYTQKHIVLTPVEVIMVTKKYLLSPIFCIYITKYKYDQHPYGLWVWCDVFVTEILSIRQLLSKSYSHPVTLFLYKAAIFISFMINPFPIIDENIGSGSGTSQNHFDIKMLSQQCG